MTPTRRTHRGLWATAAMVMCLTTAPRVQAQDSGAGSAPPPPGSWAGQLDVLTRWLEERRHESTCEDRCYVLDRFRITGDVESGVFEFVLEGSVLADGAVAVPLFGPPSQVRIDQATLDGAPARIGFDEEAYFLFTDARSFTLRGRLTLPRERALFIAGPLNAFEAEVTGGQVVEGERLSGLSATTIHFERGRDAEAERDEPTVFQLARAVRIGREISFQYVLTMRSGGDLGVVRLPLRFGEEVLEVDGSTGWRVEGEVLLLPTTGRVAEIRINGSLREVGEFSPDERSIYEWWLFESDAEHRLTVGGDGRQFDSSESPIARQQPNSRLFMVQRGQQVQVEVQRLESAEVLGAVVRQHQRTVVLTRRGDLVAEDQLTYENNGIDYLLFQPSGRAIFLSTDDRAERIMHKRRDDPEVMIPLRTGTHRVKVQSLSQAVIGTFGGRLEVPLPRHPLTTSRSGLTLGLPRFVHPFVLWGGDNVRWFLGMGDLVAVFFAILAAWLVLRGRRRRLFGSVTLVGVWFLSGPLFVAVMLALAFGGALWVLGRLLRLRTLAAVAVLGVVGVIVLAGMGSLLVVAGESAPSSEYAADDWVQRDRSARSQVSSSDMEQGGAGGPAAGRRGNRAAQLAVGGVLQGVTPVALPLPGYFHSARASRELVTEQRPFQPVLYYVTDWALLPFGLLWIGSLMLLLFGYRREAREAWDQVRERLAHPPEAKPADQPEREPEPEPTAPSEVAVESATEAEETN